MKKLVRILPIIAILSLSACEFFQKDFFRNIAGRPTAESLADFKDSVLARRQAIADSLEQLRKEVIRREIERRDSVDGRLKLEGMNIQLSDSSAFGSLSSPAPFKYNVIVGVYCQEKTASERFVQAEEKGFSPYCLSFERGGARAVCMMGDNSLVALADSLSLAIGSGASCFGAWVLVNH